jgi:hypothetical protein
METERITLPALSAGGEVITVYAYDCGAVRSNLLASTARQLAGCAGATTPVLMIDWDTSAPAMHAMFDTDPDRPGLLEWVAGILLRLGEATGDPEEHAGQVLEALDWQAFVQRVDHGRPLFFMSAGVQDDGFGERAAAFDWQALFYACPALFQTMMAQLKRHFAHIVINAPCGRSAATSICTALLPRKLMVVCLPERPSLEGACAMVARAVEARCSSPLEERQLMVYPITFGGDRDAWQLQWEDAVSDAYGMDDLSLEAWFNSPGRMLDWIETGQPPWISLPELELQQAVTHGRRDAARGTSGVVLAHDLLKLGTLCEEQGRLEEARDCYQESMELRQRLLGDEHPDTRCSRARLAEMLRAIGRMAEARFLYELLIEDGERLQGAGTRQTLAFRAGLAEILGQLDAEGEGREAFEQLVSDCEEHLGAIDGLTLECLLAQAAVLARTGEPGRARMLVERVLDVRWRQLGCEHPATLAAMEQLALLLLRAEDQTGAVRLQQQVVDGHSHQAGPGHPVTMAARETLAAIMMGELPDPESRPAIFLPAHLVQRDHSGATQMEERGRACFR